LQQEEERRKVAMLSSKGKMRDLSRGEKEDQKTVKKKKKSGILGMHPQCHGEKKC